MTDRRSLAWWCAGSLTAWVVLLGMVVTREGLAEDDGPVLRWLVEHRSGAATTLLTGVSDPVVDAVAAAGVAGVALLIAGRTRSGWPLTTLAAALGGSVVLAELIKAAVGRARPATATMLGVPETGSGFPSAHTLVMSALAGAGALVVWRASGSAPLRAGAVTLALGASVAMGGSRLYLGDHWLTDVLASYALAGVVLTAVAAGTAPGPLRDRWTAALPVSRRATSP